MKANGPASAMDRWGSSSSTDPQKSWALCVCPLNSQTLTAGHVRLWSVRKRPTQHVQRVINVVFTLPMRACPVDSLGLADRMTLLTVPKWPNVSLTDSSHSSDLEVLRCNHLFILAGSSPFTVFTGVTSKHSASDACPLTFVEVLMHSVILWFILTA